MKRTLFGILKLVSGVGLVYWLITWIGILPYDKDVKGFILLVTLGLSLAVDIAIRVRRKKYAQHEENR